ncbi:MAG: phosphoenolpyruvate--protein phosphotransferase [Actinomycetota bacterium]|nr:phosphoenolpyruvate--protein phosphotransferase [Actinomycetota bacterium]
MLDVVGLVVVSHSRALARAAVALAQQMLPGDVAPGQDERPGREVQIAVAAGLDETTPGTDAKQILQAITAVDQEAGVVVLMDLGSAVLSAELAVELLDDDTRGRVLLSPAPLVEGLVVAAVAAAAGATRQEVAAEAAAALAAKTSHLGSPAGVPHDGEPDITDSGELTATFTVVNPHGLHARPASHLVAQVRALDVRVHLRNLTTDSAWVPASSLSKVATLGASCGHELEVRAIGRQAQEALDRVLALAAGSVGPGSVDLDAIDPGARDMVDRPAAVAHASPSGPLPASPGIGIGPAWSMRYRPADLAYTRTDDPRGQWHRLQEAIAAVRRDVQRMRARTLREAGQAEAAIFDTHLLLLDDTDLLGAVRSSVDGGQAVATAWAAAVNRVSAELAALPDPYLRARASDVRAVGDQVLGALLGTREATAGQAGVLVAADLTPAQAAELDRSRVVAVLLAAGGPMAHSAILLRARGIPAVVAAGPAVLDIAAGTLVAVDGTTGEFVVDPPAEVLVSWRTRAADLARRQRQARAHAASPAVTRDGVEVLVGAHVGGEEDARVAAASGADLAGLVRTEFLFLGRVQAPGVEEQEVAYRSIAEALEGRRITLRTLDVGGDKPLDYLPTPAEANPFLGLRGIRLSLNYPTLLADQLLAMVRVAHDTPVSLLFPMISTLDELRRAAHFLDDAIALAGHGRPPGLRVGIMVEVPATALKAAAFAPHVDFFSVGTNDLTQYALAAERGNDTVAGISDPFDPGVLRLVDLTCRSAGNQTLITLCGELASDERACALLVGLGVRELSVAPRAVPRIKQAVRGVDSRDAATLAATALATESANAVRELLTDTSPDLGTGGPASDEYAPRRSSYR